MLPHNGLALSTPADPIRLNVTKSTDNGATLSSRYITNQIYGSGCSNPTKKAGILFGYLLAANTQLSSGRLVAVG
ncbi:MAG: hypothetical protein IPN82_12825 [Chitinophagaceae bacterium]|nr:hypothetical protein [Chitinophagaceae bacterium]